jgi:hypothetical protein
VFNSEAWWTVAWSLSAFALWVVLFSYVAFGLARWFKRLDAHGRPPDPSVADTSRKDRAWQPT